MFYIWGHPDAAICSDAHHMFGCPCIWIPLDTPICSNTPCISPMLPCASACSGRYLHVIGGCRGLSFSLETPICLDFSPCVQHCHAFIWSPTCLYVLGVIACTMGEHPICWGLWGFGTSVRLLVSVSTSIGCPLCFILYLSCSFIMSPVYTSLAMTTTPPVTVVSSGMSSLSSVTMAPSFDGASYNVGSA